MSAADSIWSMRTVSRGIGNSKGASPTGSLLSTSGQSRHGNKTDANAQSFRDIGKCFPDIAINAKKKILLVCPMLFILQLTK